MVKECRKCSLNALEETIQSFIGPTPVKETIVCQNCKGELIMLGFFDCFSMRATKNV